MYILFALLIVYFFGSGVYNCVKSAKNDVTMRPNYDRIKTHTTAFFSNKKCRL